MPGKSKQARDIVAGLITYMQDHHLALWWEPASDDVKGYITTDMEVIVESHLRVSESVDPIRALALEVAVKWGHNVNSTAVTIAAIRFEKFLREGIQNADSE